MLQADPCHAGALPGAATSKAVQLLQATIDSQRCHWFHGPQQLQPPTPASRRPRTQWARGESTQIPLEKLLA